jgi:hypothetical protein
MASSTSPLLPVPQHYTCILPKAAYNCVGGDAFVEAYPNFPEVQAKVCNYDWNAVYPPTAEEFAELIGR